MNPDNLPSSCPSNISNFHSNHDKLTLPSINKNLRNFSDRIYLDTPEYEHIIPSHPKHPIWDPTLPMPDTNSIIIQADLIPDTRTYPEITELELYSCHNDNLDMFPNLQILTIGKLHGKITLPTKLRELNLHVCYGAGEISNLDELTNLEALYFGDLDKRLIVNLSNYPNLQSFISERSLKLTFDGIYPKMKIFKYRAFDYFTLKKGTFPNLEVLLCNRLTKESEIQDLNKLRYLYCLGEVEVNLSNHPELEYFYGEKYLIPEQGLPNIVELNIDKCNLEFNDILFPKLKILKIRGYSRGTDVFVNHENLRYLEVSHCKNTSISAPKLTFLEVRSTHVDRVKTLGKYEHLKKYTLGGGIYDKMFVDFNDFPVLEELDAIDSLLGISGISSSLREFKFGTNDEMMDLSGFEKLEKVMIGGCLENKVIFGKNVKEIWFGIPSSVMMDGMKFRENKRDSLKYLDVSRCGKCKIDDLFDEDEYSRMMTRRIYERFAN